MKKSRLMIAGSVIGLALGAATPSFAQDQAAETATPVDEVEEEGGPILVTGSRIRQPNLESANPVAVITGQQVFETGNISVGDLLNELPQLRSTFSQQNGTRFLGTRGLNLLDLRGLGTQRTLVLVNGRRHVGSDVLSNGVSVDTNTIPSDLIDRIDVVTGGASAVYGSDAIAGVVNFILKDNFEGIQARGQAGLSKYEDAGNQFVSITAGQNFGSDGQGNVAISAEYAHSSDFYATQRPSLRTNRNFVVVDTDPGGSVNGSDGVPDRAFFNDIRFASLALGGSVLVFPNPTVAPCGSNVSAFGCSFLFQPDGTLVPQTGTRIGLGPIGNFLGGNGLKNREGQLLALSPDLQRYSVNLIGHYEFSPAFVPFIEAKYVRSEAFGSQSGPFFSQGATLGDPGGRERVRLDNPYLSGQARTLLTQQFLTTTVNPNTGGALSPAGLAAQQAAIAAGTFRFSLRRNWTDFGIRDEDITRETYRGVIGVRGDFNDDWNYEVFANYGEHKEKNIIAGNVNIQRYLLGLDTTRDASGNIVCRSSLSPATTISYLTGTPLVNPLNPLAPPDDPRLAGDIAACVPINPFGQGSVTQAARDYVLVDSVATGKITQLNIGGFVTGDTSGFFNLPGGPVSFSVGAEYRRETLLYDLDDLTQEGYAFYNAIPSFTSPAFEVKEAFGEIQIPLLSDTPFFQELTLRGNGRISDYKGATGTTYSYGGEVTWKPIEDITFRGTYARAVRAPNLSEVFSPAGQNFAPGFADPCSARNLATGSANRVANCTAAGRPAGYDFVYSSSLEIRSGGNPNLTEETSDSFTGGVLLQPSFIPGLSLSADYYDITVNDVISAVSAQQIANLCYDSPDLNNPFCPLFTRNTAPAGPAGEIPFQILEGSLLQSSANFAKLKVRGIDAQLDYRYTEGDWTFNFSGQYTHVLQNDSFTNPQNPAFKNRILEELGDPQDQVNFNASVKYKDVTFGYQVRWISSMYLNTFEDFNGLNGLPPQNADFAAVQRYPATAYMDIRGAVDVTEDFNIYVGVDNVFNRMPPFGLTGVGGGSGIFDNRGQYFYTGVVAKF